MTMRATGTFQVTSWDEKPYEETLGELKVTHARVTQTYSGAIEGEGTIEYLMLYREDGSASFVGFEQMAGRIEGRSGSIVLQHSGTYAEGTAKDDLSVVPGLGTGALSGLRGQGRYVALHDGANSFSLDYDFI
jgi:hypothetical protein